MPLAGLGVTMIINDPSRMYAALRCIESELAKENPSIASIRAIVLEAGRELCQPTPRAADVCLECANYQSCPGVNLVPDEWSCALRTRR